MIDCSRHILYLGAQLPVRSETFVYREVFALRQRGYHVGVASVHVPDRNLGSGELERLADEAVAIYGDGAWALIRDAWMSWLRQPVRASRVLAMGLRDAILGRAVPLARRPKLVVQCLAALALDQRTAEWPFVHVHAHMAHVPTSIAMYFAALRQVPFSFTGHAADLFRDYALIPAKLQRAAFVACISHWHREFYRKQVPEMSDDKMPVIRCGVVPGAVAKPKGSSDRPCQILAVGRLVEKKGFGVLIQALERLRDDQVDFACRLVGDGPEREALERQVHAAGLAPRFRFEGARSNFEIQQWLQEADLFVLPCQPARSGDRDGIPVVLMEAMAAGVAVISGDLPTIRELVHHQQTGWLVPPGSVEPLRQAILTLLSDHKLRQTLIDAGRRRVEQEFSQDINIERLIEAFALAPRGELKCRESRLS